MSGDDSSNEKAFRLCFKRLRNIPPPEGYIHVDEALDVVGRALEPMIWGRTQVWHELPFVCSKKGGKLKKYEHKTKNSRYIFSSCVFRNDVDAGEAIEASNIYHKMAKLIQKEIIQNRISISSINTKTKNFNYRCNYAYNATSSSFRSMFYTGYFIRSFKSRDVKHRVLLRENDINSFISKNTTRMPNFRVPDIVRILDESALRHGYLHTKDNLEDFLNEILPQKAKSSKKQFKNTLFPQVNN